MKTIHFNTGRKYTMHGQRITATQHDDGVVTFHDHDRMITGQLKYTLTVFSKETVLRNYDLGEYEANARAHSDGLMRGGVNSVFHSSLISSEVK